MRNSAILLYVLSVFFIGGCKSAAKRHDPGNIAILVRNTTGEADTRKLWPETFEEGSKAAYASAMVTLRSGAWRLDEALIGSSGSDHKNGEKALRIQRNGIVTMLFDQPGGPRVVKIVHAIYGRDPASTWGLWYSTNGGSEWTQAGATTTTTLDVPTTAFFSVNIKAPVRFQVRKLGGGRLNIDDFNCGGSDEKIVPATESAENSIPGTAGRDDNMALGNPDGANKNDRNKYLIVRPQYALSYNNGKGMANWVSWHLSTAWKGDAARCNCFEPDPLLPAGYFAAVTQNYTATGFDRGHLCPSDDRDGSSEDNAATFRMTNMAPQAPHLNQQTWEGLEAYCRRLTGQGKELYIIAGGYGAGGSGSNGGITSTIAGGHITVPARYWKIIVVLDNGNDDLTRINYTTRVIAVDMPNMQEVNANPWYYYRTSVDAVENATGYDFFRNVPVAIQREIELKTDDGAVR
ncbi:MAG: DNA/RNA non-specific endonuclease [Taibaiella sp.]|nr:DNA/RNA non-specific endonuclease [Taibaiella sp.]